MASKRQRKFHRGDLVEWIETKVEYLNDYCFPYPHCFPRPFPHGMNPHSITKERHTGKIVRLPANMETSFITVRDDENGSIYLLPSDRLTHLREKVKFD